MTMTTDQLSLRNNNDRKRAHVTNGVVLSGKKCATKDARTTPKKSEHGSPVEPVVLNYQSRIPSRRNIAETPYDFVGPDVLDDRVRGCGLPSTGKHFSLHKLKDRGHILEF